MNPGTSNSQQPTVNVEAINRLLELGAAAAKIQFTDDPQGIPFAIVPNGCKVETLKHLHPPQRIEQRVTLLEAGSFCEYVNAFKDARTRIFADVTETSAKFVAVLDYHFDNDPRGEGKTVIPQNLVPQYCSHIATFETIQTPEFKAWMAANRKAMDQVTFATWLEDNLQLFREPAGAELLELIQTLYGSNEVRFNSAVRLQSGGNKLHFDEDVILKGQTSTKAGEVELPPVITAGIAPFQGAPLYEIKARLKYRIESRKLSLWFETISVHTIIRDSVLLLVKEVAEKTSIVPLIGRI